MLQQLLRTRDLRILVVVAAIAGSLYFVSFFYEDRTSIISQELHQPPGLSQHPPQGAPILDIPSLSGLEDIGLEPEAHPSIDQEDAAPNVPNVYVQHDAPNDLPQEDGHPATPPVIETTEDLTLPQANTPDVSDTGPPSPKPQGIEQSIPEDSSPPGGLGPGSQETKPDQLGDQLHGPDSLEPGIDAAFSQPPMIQLPDMPLNEDHLEAEDEKKPAPAPELPDPAPIRPLEGPRQDRRLTVVVPATSSHPDLCKFIFSAIALGYPTPVIVNWGLDPFSVSKWERGQNLIKIPGVMRYLDAVLHEKAHAGDRLRDDDLVVIMDGYDVWFQLPPEVLVRRYHQRIAKVNAQLQKQWSGPGPAPMRQTIIVASEKKCYPSIESGSNLHCEALPQSPLRADLYGPATDTNSVPDDYHHDVRPRYINGGSYMGTAGDLRRMFRRMLNKVENGINSGVKLYSEQGISGEVLGEQEVWRNWRRENPQATGEMVALMEESFEYGIGLDYYQELSIPTVHAAIDGRILALNNQSAIAQFSQQLGISPVRLQGVPEDISSARNPLDDMVGEAVWGEMPLYADFFTESVPVALHHNAWKDNLKQRRVWWWDQPWFFPYLRDLLRPRLIPGPLSPLATVKVDEEEVRYWAPGSDSFWRRPRLLVDSAEEPLGELQFRDACRNPDEVAEKKNPWWDEIFRDGRGPVL